ncbi:DUF5958 family protein [Streptomyces sp. 35G-GA-8]|uniref:DUF5958 family protein n=1 Tax=Streptomyces sp. 35G-GA-8 TaxID=2939434 RepID=UPI00201EEA6B|nr:DUF5958 family protein [Streptomyces sp. 35G-GA-8]MCL7380292.1 DUF5958 family protein [Streptomyces sp. 35G-GA-8]
MADPYIILNELAQELRPMPQGIEWFEGLSAEEQSNTLRLLSHFCIQARATAEDGPESIRRAGLRATHTLAVLITRGQIDQQLGKIASLTPHDERLAATRGIACLSTPPKPRPDPSRFRAYRTSRRRGTSRSASAVCASHVPLLAARPWIAAYSALLSFDGFIKCVAAVVIRAGE